MTPSQYLSPFAASRLFIVDQGLRKRVFECGDGSAARVTFSPWTTHEQLGFRAEVGYFLWILSFGDAKESISPKVKT
ncbi:hypothetical protein JAO78_005965 [Alishewanella sp. 16-MA]|uniref:Uncharacterized protein n=1 Tax=Alishewanella maricola TaxID=2795740 RepID=A0ABS8C2Y7_9ALTE|nr:hypothetical protein [Alishewanella maricola]MCB5226355.1 hypothetical protein [Alishewanella maricola]